MLRNSRMSTIVIIALGILVAAFVVVQAYRSRLRAADVSQAQLLEWMEQKPDLCLLDVRTTDEYNSGHIPGAINIGHKEISGRLDELRPYKDKDIVVHCERGVRARIAQDILTKAGFSHVYHLAGDMAAWRNAGRPAEAATPPPGE